MLALDDSAIMTAQDPLLVVPIIPSTLTSFQPVWYLLVAGSVFLAYHLILALWNISPFHPLSHIPGPKLAAATYIPEFYYDAVLFGRYTRRIQELHEIYGKYSFLVVVRCCQACHQRRAPNGANTWTFAQDQLSVLVRMKYTAMIRVSSMKSTPLVIESVTSLPIRLEAAARKETLIF